MNRIERFKLLQVFGDGKEHNWFEVIFLGVNFLKIHQKKFESFLADAIGANLIRMVETDEIRSLRTRESYQICKQDYMYQITSKGDECLRNEQIARHGDPDYYKNFDRTVDGKHGLGKYAPLPKGLGSKRGEQR